MRRAIDQVRRVARVGDENSVSITLDIDGGGRGRNSNSGEGQECGELHIDRRIGVVSKALDLEGLLA